MLKQILIIIMMCGAIFGCSIGSKEESFSINDFCFIKKDNQEIQICYGMKKDDVENLIGKGEVGNIFRQAEYEGIRIAYREDSVVSMTIDGGGEYKTTRGAELGMLKTAMKNLYGETGAMDLATRNLDYAFDSKFNKLLDDIREADGRLEDVLYVSIMFDPDGYADFLMLADARYAIMLE